MNLQKNLTQLLSGWQTAAQRPHPAMQNMQPRIVAILLRWPWDGERVLHAGDIQGELRRQGGEAPLPAVVAALQALAQQQALRLGPGSSSSNVQILEIFPVRLEALR
jgi:hypothetical protein